MKISKEIQEVVSKLQKDGKQVFVNEIGEVFTIEAYAKASGHEYEEVKGKVSVPEEGKKVDGTPAAKPLTKMNAEELKAVCAEKEIEVIEGMTKAQMIEAIEAKSAPKGDEGKGE